MSEHESWLDAARAEHPSIRVDRAEFAAFVAARVSSAPDGWSELDGGDLYLACALAKNDPRALAIFEERVMPRVERSLARIDRSASFIDEAKQLLRQKLFVGDDPQIKTYGGRSSLARWAAVTASRLALNMKRSVKREIELEDEVLGALPAGADPELEYVWTKYRETYLRALEVALAGLEAREKNLLRQHYVDRLDLDELGRIYQVHRTTAFRWLKRAEELLAENTRDALEELGVSASELRSVQRVAQSRFQLSLVRLLERASAEDQ